MHGCCVFIKFIYAIIFFKLYFIIISNTNLSQIIFHSNAFEDKSFFQINQSRAFTNKHLKSKVLKIFMAEYQKIKAKERIHFFDLNENFADLQIKNDQTFQQCFYFNIYYLFKFYSYSSHILREFYTDNYPDGM